MTGHKADALKVCGSIYRWNAPNAIGYLYNSTNNGREVACGMYCDRVDEINPAQWTYFLCFKDKRFYHLDKPRSLAAARKAA